MADAATSGTATSDDGRIRAVLDAAGRLQDLHLDPGLLRRGRGGTALDSTGLADRIRDTVNSAYDDLVANLERQNANDMADITDDLKSTVAGFERSLNELGEDIRRSMREVDLDIAAPPRLRYTGQ